MRPQRRDAGRGEVLNSLCPVPALALVDLGLPPTPHSPVRYIDAALKLGDGNLSQAARLLGVNRTTLYSKIERLASSRG